MKRQLSLKAGDKIAGYGFLLPAVLFMAAFVIAPIVYNIVISLQDVTAMTLIKSHREFIGLDNYVAIFKSGFLQNAIVNSFGYSKV